MSSQASVLLEGTFDAFSFDEVLDVVAISRQTLELTVRDDDDGAARVVVRGGRVLSAADRAVPAGSGAFVSLYQHRWRSFVVSVLGGQAGAPIGSLVDLVAKARAAARSAPAPAARGARRVVLEGTFERFPIADVLDVLSLSRQPLKLVFLEEGRPRGVMVTKAGQVVIAHDAKTDIEGRAAFLALYANPGDGFVVRQRRDVPDGLTPVGSLASLVAEARSREPTPLAARRTERPPELVLEGDLVDFPLREVLDVLSLSRQCLHLRTLRGGQLVGELCVKAGHLLWARCGDDHDSILALASLLEQPGTSFTVHRETSVVTPIDGYRLSRALELAGEWSHDAQPTALHAPMTPSMPPAAVLLDAEVTEVEATDRTGLQAAVRELAAQLADDALTEQLSRAGQAVRALEERVAAQQVQLDALRRRGPEQALLLMLVVGQVLTLAVVVGLVLGGGMTVRSPLLEVGDQVDGAYRVTRVIGRGGMATVYAALRLEDRQRVAIKVMHADEEDEGLGRRFFNELVLATRVVHPNLVAVHDFGLLRSTGSPYIVMEHLVGHTLRREVKAHGAMAIDRVMPLFLGVLSALEQAHGAGVVHQDLKPSNLFLSQDGPDGETSLVVLDFGVASRVRQDDPQEGRPTEVRGTPAYMAPETIRGDPVGPPSDVYQLGLTLAEVLSGRRVVQDKRTGECFRRHLGGDLDLSLDGVPDALAAVVVRATALDPAHRYADAGQLRWALEDVVRARPVVRRTEPPPLVRGGPPSVQTVITDGSLEEQLAPRGHGRVPLPPAWAWAMAMAMAMAMGFGAGLAIVRWGGGP